MFILSLIFSLTPFLSLVISLPSIQPTRRTQSGTAKAVYFLTNKAQNSVVALNVASDGIPSDGPIVSTGGASRSALQGDTGMVAAPDSLFSGYGSVHVAGNILLAVNSGSNTITMFSIKPSNPTQLTQVGSPVSTLGDFPHSIDISLSLNQACVANTGTLSGITCFHIGQNGLTHSTPLIPYSLNQTNPPMGLVHGAPVPATRPMITSVTFSPDNSALLATISGNPYTQTNAYLAYYPITKGTISETPILSLLPNTPIPFQVLNIPNTPTYLLTDVTIGSALLSLSPSTHRVSSTPTLTKIPGELATCWSALSPRTGTIFLTDALVNRFVEIDPGSGNIVSIVNDTLSGSNLGHTDLVAVGDLLWALSPGLEGEATQVVVLDVGGGRGRGKVVQSFRPKGLGALGEAQAVQGMTVWVG